MESKLLSTGQPQSILNLNIQCSIFCNLQQLLRNSLTPKINNGSLSKLKINLGLLHIAQSIFHSRANN